MNRRKFLTLAAAASAGAVLPLPGSAQNSAIPIIDTHIHLFDTARPQGVPWPTKKDSIIYRPALPERYRKIAVPLGVVGAIVVEASPLPEDNQWVLDLASKNKIILGTVGNLEPGKANFSQQLERLRRNPLFRGIRYGNLWGRDISRELLNPAFVSDLRAVAEAGLVLDTANPNPALIAAVVRVTDLVPNLRVIVDHLPQITPPEAPAARKDYEAALQKLGDRPQVYVKISQVLRRIDGNIPQEPGFYRPGLDELFGIFGEDRLLYGSDWPNSDRMLPYDAGLSLVSEYFGTKGRSVAEKYFWKNSIAAYQWVKRQPSQPG